MRIISQDGALDLPYERFVISVNMQNQGEIIAWTGNHISDDECIVMAVYSSFAKAQKAMEMLHEEYGKHLYGQGGAMATANFYVPPFAFIPPKVFQFQKDEDLEV